MVKISILGISYDYSHRWLLDIVRINTDSFRVLDFQRYCSWILLAKKNPTEENIFLPFLQNLTGKLN